MPQANSTFSRPRATSPSASDEHLAVLGGEQRGDLLAVGVDSSRRWNITSARRDRLVARHAGNAALADGDGGVDLVDAGEVDRRRLLARWPG